MMDHPEENLSFFSQINNSLFEEESLFRCFVIVNINVILFLPLSVLIKLEKIYSPSLAETYINSEKPLFWGWFFEAFWKLK